MEFIVLRTDWDAHVAESLVERGEAVRVGVDYETGPDGLEPRIELLRLLLDQVKRRFGIEERRYVPHPLVPGRYLQSCVIQPAPPGRSSGVREPRVPNPDPEVATAVIDRRPAGGGS